MFICQFCPDKRFGSLNWVERHRDSLTGSAKLVFVGTADYGNNK